jgi:replicative DNA helicase
MIQIHYDQDIQLEMTIIGSLLVDKNSIDIVLGNLQTDDFNDEKCKLVYNSVLRLFTTAKGIDMLTVFNDMKQNKEPEILNFLMECTNIVGSTANIESHIYFIKNNSAKRKLLELGYKIISESINESKSTLDKILNALTDLTDIQNRITPKKTKDFKEVLIETIEESLNVNKSFLGIKTGFNKFDSVSGGYCSPDFTIIAAGPGEGKSTLALNQAKNISLSGKRVLYFSLEMKEKQMIWKLLSDELNISVLDVRMGHYAKDHAIKTELTKANLAIYDKGGLTIDDLISIVKMEKKSNGVEVVFIDYLQLLRLGSYYRKVSNKNDEVTIISNKLKQLCMDVDLPIIALSQLNRDKTRKRYALSDLRDSGSLEQDADNVIFIFRPFEHQLTEYTIGKNLIQCDESTAILNIEKCRLGQTGEFEMVFNGQCSRFEDLGQNNPLNYESSIKVNRNSNETIPF